MTARSQAPVVTEAPAPTPATAASIPAPEGASPETPAPPIAARLAGWLAPARRLVARTPRWQLAAAAGIGVALCLLIAGAALGIAPLSRGHSYPTAGAPSDPAGRLAYFRDGAQAGDANAALQLAILFLRQGRGGDAGLLPPPPSGFRAAANKDVPRAQYDMGVLYERGRGVQVDLTEAANWYLKAAQGGHPLAEYNLAVCYTKGQGIRKDLPEAALWYRRAATQGVVQAMVNLALMYEKGDGVGASPVDAYAWFLAAGRRDNQVAARHAEDMFTAMPRMDQIRAEALASDVAASIHDPERGDKPPGATAGGRS